MKKLALFCAVAAVASGALAGDGYKFKFASSGDTYADGSAVQNGEVYALVWTANGTFAGFNADGSLADSATSDVMAYSLAKDGGCPTTVRLLRRQLSAFSRLPHCCWNVCLPLLTAIWL